MAVKGTRVGATVVLALCGAIGVAEAQERKDGVEVKAGQGNVRVDVDAKRGQDRNANRDNSAWGMAHRASEIQGMTVMSDANAELGTVKDIVIDVRAGQVKYAALTYGGLLGVGDKLFAIPWDAFQHRHNADSDEHTLVLGIDEGTLKDAPGFDQSEWPNFADAKFSDEIDKHYRKFRRQARRSAKSADRDLNVDIKAGRVDIDLAVDRDRASQRREGSSKGVVHRASEITGMHVKNAAGKDLGSVNDLVVDMESGKVRYAALSYGGLLGVGDKLFAVPWNAFDCQYNPSEEKATLVLSIDEATLRKASGFNQDNWPNLADPTFGEEIDKYYGLEGQRSNRPASRVNR